MRGNGLRILKLDDVRRPDRAYMLANIKLRRRLRCVRLNNEAPQNNESNAARVR